MLIVKINEHAVCGKCSSFCRLGAHKLHVQYERLNVLVRVPIGK